MRMRVRVRKIMQMNIMMIILKVILKRNQTKINKKLKMSFRMKNMRVKNMTMKNMRTMNMRTMNKRMMNMRMMKKIMLLSRKHLEQMKICKMIMKC